MHKRTPAWVEYMTAAGLIVVLWALALSALWGISQEREERGLESAEPVGGVSISPAGETQQGTLREAGDVPPMPEDPEEQDRITAALVEQGYFREDVPLSYDLQDALHAICDEAGVEYALALGLIQHESGFDPEARNGVSYGLCQLNTRYFPDGLSPEDNLEAGIRWLGELLARYDIRTALDIYHSGHDTGDTVYPGVVKEYAEKWGETK